jgi:hypothetical protein
MRKNKNRGYQKLPVWEDAVNFYVLCCRVFGKFPYGLSRIASQAIASSDSVHRNIAEEHCRRSIREYLNLLRLVESLERKEISGDWIDHLVVKESNVVYGTEQINF